MAKKRLQAGIVGTGFSARFHFEALRKVYGVDVEVAGVYSRTRKNCERFARERRIKVFDDLDALIDACDVIHVCTPLITHESIAIKVLEQDKYPIVEKPLTGFCGDGSEEFRGDRYPKEKALKATLDSIDRILAAERSSKACILYSENWVYAPSVQKEREIIEKTEAQILWMHGEESHSGSHSAAYGFWKFSGGGVMLTKGCHPLTAALYLKCKEGIARSGHPIRPMYVTSRVHAITQLDTFVDQGHIRSDYHDIDDFSMMHVEFEDGTVADIFSSDIILGGIHNWLEVAANNHRTICNINPNTLMQTYNPVEANFKDIYVVEKIGTKQGWSNPAPDEDWATGYPEEIEAFYRTAAYKQPLEADSRLAADVISTIYSAYVSAEREGKRISIKNF